MTSGFFSSTSMAARMVFGFVSESTMFPHGFVLFKIDEGVIPLVSAALVPPFPFLGRIEAFAGQSPVEQIGLFFLVAVGLHDDILVLPTDPHDFAQGLA